MMPYAQNKVGWKAGDTARKAAEAMSPKAPSLREQVLDVLTESGREMTADEIADALGKSFISIRPRCTELSQTGKIVDSGIRRATSNGSRQIAWMLSA
jgi:predicted ArsR family transcriptional regulator